jgi:hypothetical protein
MSTSLQSSAPAGASIPRTIPSGWRRLLVAGGAAAFVLYLAMDIVAALRYEGYSYTGQTISELSAIGAPTRAMWAPLGVVYALLMLAFGAGVWLLAGSKRSLRIIGALATFMGALALFVWPFAPMHQREVLAAGGGSFTDTLHLILGGTDTLIFFASMIAGLGVFGRRFRYYTLATIAVVLVAGVLTGLAAPGVQKDESTPWIGVTERVSVFGSMLWYAVLAVGLLRRPAERGNPGEEA